MGMRDTTGPRHWRITARNLDLFRSQALCGRQLSDEEISKMSKRPSSNPPPARPPGSTAPDKNPPFPPTPPTPPKKP